MAEGVFTASGADCYECFAYIHQTPELGRETYVIQFNAKHVAKDGHSSDNHQQLVITFNQPVKYSSSNGQLKSGDGTCTLTIDYAYWNNPSDNIGLGDLSVESGDNLSITGCVLYDLAKKYN